MVSKLFKTVGTVLIVLLCVTAIAAGIIALIYFGSKDKTIAQDGNQNSTPTVVINGNDDSKIDENQNAEETKPSDEIQDNTGDEQNIEPIEGGDENGNEQTGDDNGENTEVNTGDETGDENGNENGNDENGAGDEQNVEPVEGGDENGNEQTGDDNGENTEVNTGDETGDENGNENGNDENGAGDEQNVEPVEGGDDNGNEQTGDDNGENTEVNTGDETGDENGENTDPVVESGLVLADEILDVYGYYYLYVDGCDLRKSSARVSIEVEVNGTKSGAYYKKVNDVRYDHVDENGNALYECIKLSCVNFASIVNRVKQQARQGTLDDSARYATITVKYVDGDATLTASQVYDLVTLAAVK